MDVHDGHVEMVTNGGGNGSSDMAPAIAPGANITHDLMTARVEHRVLTKGPVGGLRRHLEVFGGR